MKTSYYFNIRINRNFSFPYVTEKKNKKNMEHATPPKKLHSYILLMLHYL